MDKLVTQIILKQSRSYLNSFISDKLYIIYGFFSNVTVSSNEFRLRSVKYIESNVNNSSHDIFHLSDTMDIISQFSGKKTFSGSQVFVTTPNYSIRFNYENVE